MSKENKTLKIRFDGFNGIDLRRTHSGDKSIKDIVNFRIKDDGSLEKRCGFTSIYTPLMRIRGIWSGTIGGEFVCYLVDGSRLIKLDVDTKETQDLGSIGNSTGKVHFFFYRDTLYLSDNIGLYRITQQDGIDPIVGYVPLYGKEWATTFPGEIYEPLNLFNRYARITYRATEEHTNMLATSLPVAQIYSIYKNGELLSPDSYSYDADVKAIAVSSVDPGDFFEVALLFEGNLPQSNIYESTQAFVFGGAHNSRIFMWGSSEKNLVFVSRHVSKECLDESERMFPACGPIYFPEGNCEFTVGDSKNKITAMLRHYDRLLIFSDCDTWVAESSDCDREDIPIMRINTSVGCVSNNGVSMGRKNSPVTIGAHTIHYWTSETDRLEECNALPLSEEINERLSNDFFENAIIFKDNFRDEIWFHQVGSTENTWVYNLSSNKWVRFTNINASMFFATKDDVGFVANDLRVLKFTKDMYKDKYTGFDQSDITASLKTGILDFDTECKKRLSSLAITADLDGGSIQVNIESDNGSITSKEILHQEGVPSHYTEAKRLTSDRFSHINEITLTAPGSTRQTIHKFELRAKRLGQ